MRKDKIRNEHIRSTVKVGTVRNEDEGGQAEVVPSQQCYAGAHAGPLQGAVRTVPVPIWPRRCSGSAWVYRTTFMWFKLFMQKLRNISLLSMF